jgi:ferredoxin-type protein NapH
MSGSTRASLLPGDLVLRHGRRYQWLRRSVLTGSVLFVVLAPLWHLWWDARVGAGLALGAAPLDRLAATAPIAPVPPLALGAPWAFRLFGLEFMDPLAGLSLLAARGLHLEALFGLIPVLVLMVGLGRFFCGWICPYIPLIAVSNNIRSLFSRLGVRLPDIELPRRTGLAVLLALLTATAISGSLLVPLFYPPTVISRSLWRLVFQGSFGAGVSLVLSAFVFDTFVSRAGFCRSLCPGGTLFSLLSVRSPVVVKRTKAKCTDCVACDVVCNLGQQPMTDRLDAGCERCGKCIAVCPTDALRFALRRGAP